MYQHLSLFSNGFSFAIQMASAMPRPEPVLFFAFDCDGFRSKTVIIVIHMFTDRGTPLLVFFESCTQWVFCLSNVGCLAVCTANMVHQARLFTFLDFVLWSYQTGQDGVERSYMGSHT